MRIKLVDMSTKCILCTQEIHRKFTGNSQKRLTGNFQEVHRKFSGSFQEIARKGSQEAHRKLTGNFQGVFREFAGISQGSRRVLAGTRQIKK